MNVVCFVSLNSNWNEDETADFKSKGSGKA